MTDRRWKAIERLVADFWGGTRNPTSGEMSKHGTHADMEVPELTIGHVETPSPYTPHGVKGGGEGGRMMAPAAINAAVNDALFPLGVRLTELPMTPERILSALRAAGPVGDSAG